jgi:hypothetical protein
MKLKSYTDASGVTHSQAVWLPVTIHIEHERMTAYVTFKGYASAAAFASGKQPLAGATKEYILRGHDYLARAAQLLGPISTVAYEWAMAYLDTPNPEGGDAVSFFHGCDDV